MRSLVTGGAGFIASHLCEALVRRGWRVVCADNLYLGRRENVASLEGGTLFRFVEMDALDRRAMAGLFEEERFEAVFHLAANSDISRGTRDRTLDLRLGFETTISVLEAMVEYGVADLFFASTSAVFGETGSALSEESGPLRPISLYGASKLAAEAYISAYASLYGMRARVLRFPNVVGPRMTHGAIFDFVSRLRKDPERLVVLGDGKQSKPYLHVDDLVEAILLVWDRAREPLAVYHVGNQDRLSVAEMVQIVLDETGLRDAQVEYTGGDRGWPGDVPCFEYDFGAIRRLGQGRIRSSAEAVRAAVRALAEQRTEPDGPDAGSCGESWDKACPESGTN